MRFLRQGLLACGLLAAMAAPLDAGPSSAGPSSAGSTRTDAIRERLLDANRWRDHVMVVAHRGGGLAGRRMLYPENSLNAVESAIRAGAEVVEVDIQKSKDGEYVVFHDTYLDRTSTCRGRLAERTLAELQACRLVVEGTGTATAETVPSLRQMFEATRGRALVNIDNKLAPSELPGIVALARTMGMADQVIVKLNLWNEARIAEARGLLSGMGPDVLFMPIVADDAVRDAGFLDELSHAFAPVAAEVIHWRREGDTAPTVDGGPLFSPRARAAAVRGNLHLWVNTYNIVNKAAGWLAGGRGDDLAVLADRPAESFGFWVERGATVIQTDEPELAIRWLDRNGYRVPYRGAAPAEVSRQEGIGLAALR